MENSKWYVEFSLDQDCFHIDTMEAIQRINRGLCQQRINNGYVIIGGPFDSLEEAGNFSEKYEDFYSQARKDREKRYIEAQKAGL